VPVPCGSPGIRHFLLQPSVRLQYARGHSSKLNGRPCFPHLHTLVLSGKPRDMENFLNKFFTQCPNLQWLFLRMGGLTKTRCQAFSGFAPTSPSSLLGTEMLKGIRFPGYQLQLLWLRPKDTNAGVPIFSQPNLGREPEPGLLDFLVNLAILSEYKTLT